MVARPDLRLLLPPGLLVPDLNDLGVVLEDLRHALPGEHLAPKVVSLDAVRVQGIPRAVVPAAVEGEETRFATGQMRAETCLVFVDREVSHAPPELEEPLTGITVLAILPDCVVDGLFREAVLQFEREDRETVDEERNVQRALRLVAAVAQLPGHGETVLAETLAGRVVALRGATVEQLEIVRAVADTVAQHVDGAALADFALYSCEKLASNRTVLEESQRLTRLWLSSPKESGQLDQIEAMVAVVVEPTSGAPTHPAIGTVCFPDGVRLRRFAWIARQCDANQPFETLFACVGGHPSGTCLGMGVSLTCPA